MRQQDATPQNPFHSVCYQYNSSPWTLYSCNRYDRNGRTMQGTGDLELAKRVAERCVSEPGICYAAVSMTTDCYNHNTVYEVGRFKLGTIKGKSTPQIHEQKETKWKVNEKPHGYAKDRYEVGAVIITGLKRLLKNAANEITAISLAEFGPAA